MPIHIMALYWLEVNVHMPPIMNLSKTIFILDIQFDVLI